MAKLVETTVIEKEWLLLLKSSYRDIELEIRLNYSYLRQPLAGQSRQQVSLGSRSVLAVS